MLFDLTHILYMVISAAISAVILVLAAKFLKSEDKKVGFLKIVAVIVGILLILLFGRKFIFRMIRKSQIRKHKAERRRRR